ncbi:class I fructose-bisphosphate aldolase [Oryzicola mucosus]|uniref:Aldolase n=1 Tax=Oryzicola mucosus TaxID=2767425 RepID=A0A8J6U617_9HYPH|nr:aldolase [Oryzicola mucosus]MBD0417415.1 aldolase [Oryzicola mucosus]
MEKYRLQRLFDPTSKRALIVAIDHALFNNNAFLPGIENMAESVSKVAGADADGILLSVGEAPHLQKLPGRGKPGLLLRVDPANFYNTIAPVSRLHCRAYDNAVEIALRLDAACILLNLLQIDDHPEMLNQCVENILRVKNDCDRYGMPMAIEPLSFKTSRDGYIGDGNPQRVTTLARMAAELGADLIKTDATEPEEEFHRVIEAASGVPVTVRGGSKASDREVLEHTERLVAQGVAGLIYGRNIIQHEKPSAMTRALKGILHDEKTADEALEMLRAG